MNGAIAATYKNRVATVAYRLLRLCSDASCRFRWDHFDFNSRTVKNRHDTLDECCSPFRMLARSWVVNQCNAMHPM
jgi:hypothetical protein